MPSDEVGQIMRSRAEMLASLRPLKWSSALAEKERLKAEALEGLQGA